jgi:hypothetical protein
VIKFVENYKIEVTEGECQVSGEKLRSAGVTTVDKLLKTGKTKNFAKNWLKSAAYLKVLT